jgi:hypothetical protein
MTQLEQAWLSLSHSRWYLKPIAGTVEIVGIARIAGTIQGSFTALFTPSSLFFFHQGTKKGKQFAGHKLILYGLSLLLFKGA